MTHIELLPAGGTPQRPAAVVYQWPGSPGSSGLFFDLLQYDGSRITGNSYFYDDSNGRGQSPPITLPHSGTYYVRVEASDAPSNSPATALVGSFESVSFDIDNTPPVVEVQSAARAGGKTTVRFAVRDEQSAVLRVEYSLDASKWRVAYPVDGIPDSRREDFEVTLEDGRRQVVRL